MAINFPNYLAAALYKPDYSGIGDVVDNYYKGKAMPKDDLIKQIQAQFARPNAEEALTGSRLGNEKTRLENTKTRREMAQQADLESQIAKALGGGGMAAGQPPMGAPQGMPSPARGQQMPQMPQQQPNPDNMIFQQGQNPMEGLPPQLMQVIQQMRQQQGQQAPQEGQQPPMGADMGASQPGAQQAAPAAETAPEANPAAANPLQILTQGEPRLAAIDSLYDRNPLSRALLEKKGFKKSQKIEFDKKTGQTRIMTSYPSGKVTLQVLGSAGAAGDGIPLTNAGVTRHQKIISSVDNAIPVLDKILNLKGFSAYPLSSLGIPSVFGNKQAEYNSLVSQTLDSLMGAFGMPSTNEGLKSVRDQLEIRHFETPSAYRDRIRKLKKDLESRKQYSEKEVKRTNKIAPIERSGSAAESMSDEELEAAANG